VAITSSHSSPHQSVVCGTPLLDIKSYVPRADCFEATRIGWLEGKDTGETIGDAGSCG